ncbi:hypothetical protein HGRIS_013723 [Hohenbuehelia grisea]|uniref:Glyoxalase-like domain-containing protein n=1 Tax=Hohenbuehelia grisea TaxID=104357 RepID=A0ABR3IWF3_9AGAR
MSESSSPSTKILDHIVHLAPPGALEETKRSFTELGFKVVPGGVHKDGLTANALVVLGDSSYLELLIFTKPVSAYPPSSPERAARECHPWAPKSPGWIDFAFLGTGVDADSDPSRRISNIINTRARQDGSLTEYLPEVAGGRERPDGKVLEWVISSPHEKHGRGTLPFFCGDVTPRDRRVPYSPPSNSEHPNGAKGVAHLLLLSVPERFNEVQRQLTSVVGRAPIQASNDKAVWALESPLDIPGTEATLVLRPAEGDLELAFASASQLAGVYEIAFWVPKGRERKVLKTPYGQVVLQPLE